MKHKVYSNSKSKSIPMIVSKLEDYLTKQAGMEIVESIIENGENQVLAKTKNDIFKRVIGQNKTIWIGIKESNSNKEVEVRVGNGSWFNRAVLIGVGAVFPPLLPATVGVTVIGAKSQNDVFKDIWAIIDNYFD